MTQPLHHALYTPGDRRMMAMQNFVSGLRAFILNDMANGMKNRYEKHVEPQLLKSNSKPPKDGVEVHKAIKDDIYFKFYSSMRYNTQEMVWRSVQRPLNQNLEGLNETAAKLMDKADSVGGSIELNPDLPLPKNVSEIDVHLAPGSYHEEFVENDVASGAIYDHGLNVFSFGMMGSNLDDIGQSFANYIRLKFPDFKPKAILDMGCTVGHNSCAWAKT